MPSKTTCGPAVGSVSAAAPCVPRWSCRIRFRPPAPASRHGGAGTLTPSTARTEPVRRCMHAAAHRKVPLQAGDFQERLGTRVSGDRSPRPASTGRGQGRQQAHGCTGARARRRAAPHGCGLDDGAGVHHRHPVGQTFATTLRSWLIQITRHVTRWPRSSVTRSRICACTVTSSAVVGSSAMRRCGVARKRHRDHHPLAHSAGKLVRIVMDPLVRAGNADRVQQFDRASPVPRAAPDPRCTRKPLGELPPDREHGIERGAGVLERPSRSPRRAHPASRRRRASQQVAAPDSSLRRRRPAHGPAASNLSTESMATVLPQPLSPISARVSPRRTEKLTPLTACTTPWPVRKRVWRPRTRRRRRGGLRGGLRDGSAGRSQPSLEPAPAGRAKRSRSAFKSTHPPLSSDSMHAMHHQQRLQVIARLSSWAPPPRERRRRNSFEQPPRVSSTNGTHASSASATGVSASASPLKLGPRSPSPRSKSTRTRSSNCSR